MPIVFVTAGARDRDRVFRGYEAGAVDFLFKPVEPHILRNKVQTFLDLHRHRRALAEQLELRRKSEEFRQRMLEGSSDCIEVLDLAGTVLRVEAAGRAAAGSEPPTAAGQNWLDRWGGERAAAEDALRAARAGGIGRFRGRIDVPGGDSTWWDVVVTPIRGADGEPEQLLVIERDTTEQRSAERAREQLVLELQETLRLNELFTAVLGHDLRNPLGAILLSSEVLSSRAEDERAKNVVERVRRAGKRMSRMIDDMLDLARARLGGGIPIRPKPMNLGEAAHRATEEAHMVCPEREINVVLAGDLDGQWDDDRLGQLFSNLISNALRHGDTTSPIRVELDGGAVEAVRLSVHNRGVIPASLRESLFDPFRSGSSEASRGNAKDGLGLGLYIVDQIATAHGGHVDVKSDEAAGTTFTVVLPRRMSVSLKGEPKPKSEARENAVRADARTVHDRT
ncbi:MAG: ATP-binding protein [Polyangiales bacterium]